MTPQENVDNNDAPTDLQTLVNAATDAWRKVGKAREQANAADKAVEKFLRGSKQVVVLEARATGRIAGGTVHPSSQRLTNQPGRVSLALYYMPHGGSSHEDILRIITPEGTQWQMTLSQTQLRLAESPEPVTR